MHFFNFRNTNLIEWVVWLVRNCKRAGAFMLIILRLQCLLTATESDGSMPFLHIEKGQLIATHGLPFVFQVPEGWNIMEPYSYRANPHGNPFCITVCAFWKEDSIIAVHAERLEDDSGSLNYSYLEPAMLSDIPFFSQERVAALDQGAVEKAKDLKYFKSQGFNFSPSIYLRQYFYHSKDGNAEYVVTIGRKTGDQIESNVRFASDLDNLAAQISLTLSL